VSVDFDDPDDGLLLPVGAEPVKPTEPATTFRDVHHFVSEYPVTIWARAVRETDTAHKWCPHWDQHPAAVEQRPSSASPPVQSGHNLAINDLEAPRGL
jgi:Domain of unknown function (DUF4913)